MSKMEPATAQKVQFSAVVEVRIVKLAKLMASRGIVFETSVPESIRHAMIRMRHMHKRFGRRDMRCSNDEVQAEQEVAGWLIEKWHEVNQTPVPKTVWTSGSEGDPDTDKNRHGKGGRQQRQRPRPGGLILPPGFGMN